MARKPLLHVTAGVLLSTAALAIAPAAGAAPTPPSDCAIVPETFADGSVGTLNTWFFLTTGCSTSEKPVRFKVVDGRIPAGTSLFTQGVSSGGITGVPTTEGVFAFTIQVRDATGTKDTESFTIAIDPPQPLVITNQGDTLSPGAVGELYCCGNLFAGGGVPDYTWSLVAGELPPGSSSARAPGGSRARRRRPARSPSPSGSPTRAARSPSGRSPSRSAEPARPASRQSAVAVGKPAHSAAFPTAGPERSARRGPSAQRDASRGRALRASAAWRSRSCCSGSARRACQPPCSSSARAAPRPVRTAPSM